MTKTKTANESIVLDLDGVIADISSSLISRMPKDQLIDGKHSFSSWLTPPFCDEAIKVFNDPLFWANMKPYEDAWYQVNYWFSMGYDIHIVTARRQPSAMEQTLPWLEKWNINSAPPIFCSFGEKINVIKDIDPIFVIEDSPYEIEILEQSGVKCFLRKHSYNEDAWSDMNTIDTLLDIELQKPAKLQRL